jgi:acetate---CoA ligase (ADP-forming)
VNAPSLTPLFAFEGLAVIGGSARNAYAAPILAGLVNLGYSGKVACINPRGEAAGDVPGYTSLGEIPFAVDAAAIVVRADRIPEILEECGAAGVRAVTIVSTGFAEVGGDGIALQGRLAEIARRYGIVVCGPNCLGALSVHDRTSTYSRSSLRLEPGPVGVVAHSGGMLNEVLSYGTYRGLRFSKLVSSGNEAVVTLPDYLEHLIDDPATTTIGIIAEGVREPDRLRAAFARAAALRKPIVAIKIGTSVLAQASAATHTGAMAGSADLFAALCDQFDALLVEDIDELVETLLMLSHAHEQLQKTTPPRGLAALEISGGGKGLICDLSERAGVPIPPLAPATMERLTVALAGVSQPSNPVDLVLSWESNASLVLHEAVLDALVADAGIDTIVSRVSVLPNGAIENTLAHGRLIERFRAAHPDRLFAVLGRASDAINPVWREFCRTTGLLYLQGYRRGTAALGRYWRYRNAGLHGPAVLPEPPGLPSLPKTNGMLDEGETKDVLAALGFAVNATTFVTDVDAAAGAARRIGFPVVVKGLSPLAVHKSDGGFVALGLADEEAVRERAAQILTRLHALGPSAGGRVGLSVQQQVALGLEVIVGGYLDAVYGPVVLCALGGVFAEAFTERHLWLAPVGAATVLRTLKHSTIGRLAAGFRTIGAVDLQPLATAVARLSAWIAADERIRELDLNPVILRGSEIAIVDARALIAPISRGRTARGDARAPAGSGTAQG